MRFAAVTIKDIAKILGLATSTVSRALRDSHEISSETKRLVLECAEKLNYSPNPTALSLKERRTRSIGVVVCEVANSFFSQAIDGIESIAYSKGYNVIISQSLESYDRELNDLHNLSSHSIDGLLISLSTETSDVSYLLELQEKGLPIVFFDRVIQQMNTHSVVVNNFKGAYEITEHLIQNGHKNIAIIAGSEFLSNTIERVAGYKEALKAHNIEPDALYIKYCFSGGMLFSEIEDAVSSLLKLKHKPDAIFTASDRLTIGSLKTLKKNQINLPGDLALAGFCNSDIAELLNPSLTVVRQPAFEIGKVAAELLFQLIESRRPVTNFEKIVLAPELHIRDSSK